MLVRAAVSSLVAPLCRYSLEESLRMASDAKHQTCIPHAGTRRHGLGLAGAAILASSGAARAAPDREDTRSVVHKPHTGVIDVHHHIRPPNAPPPVMQLMESWSPEIAIADMDAAGVATGMAFPGMLLGPDAQQNRTLSRSWNEYAARLGHDHPGRFGLFAALPMTDVDGTLDEIDYAVDQLHADGFGVASNYGERWLGDDSFQPIWKKLNTHKAVVFVHPSDAPCCTPPKMSYMKPGMDGSWIEWPMNTARTILSLMLSGAFRRYPDVRFIFSHGGGVMPLLVERVAGLAAWNHVGPDKLKELFPYGIQAEFARLHFECAQACSRTNMGALRSLVPDSNILFGSDYPIFPLSYAAQMFAGLDLPAETLARIGRRNAQGLLPRWA